MFCYWTTFCVMSWFENTIYLVVSQINVWKQPIKVKYGNAVNYLSETIKY